MRPAALAILVAAAALAMPSRGAEAPSSIPSPPPSAVDPATGERVVLDPAQGPMHVMFLATWCQPCLAEIPKLFDLDDRWKADGYRLFLVAVPTRQSAARLKDFGAQQPHPGRLLYDADGSASAAFGAANIPIHVVVDTKGNVVARSGAVDPALKSTVERLVRQQGGAARP